jgi:transposase
MVTLGTDAHKRSHTIVAADEQGRQLGQVTVTATPQGHLQALVWAGQWPTRRWAIEDCRHLSRRLERDLLAAGEQLVRVPPKLMAGARRGARTPGKSDPIDALAVARAALREPGLPAARLDGPDREVRLLVDHREIWSPSGPEPRTGCAGICTSWSRAGSFPRAGWTGRSGWTRSLGAWRAIRGWWPRSPPS